VSTITLHEPHSGTPWDERMPSPGASAVRIVWKAAGRDAIQRPRVVSAKIESRTFQVRLDNVIEPPER